MFKKAMAIVGSTILAGSLILGSGVAANATPTTIPSETTTASIAAKKVVKASVSIKTIGKKTVTAKTVTVKPSYKKAGKPKIVSAALTVTRGSKTLVKNKASASLKPGKYKVTQTVKYKLPAGKAWGKTKTAKKSQTLQVGVLAWKSYAAGYQAAEVKSINNYRKTKGLKALKFDVPLAEKAYSLLTKFDYEAALKYPALNTWAGPAIEGYKVKNNDWYAAGYASGSRKIKGNYERQYRQFLNKKLTKVGVGVHITWDNNKTKRPEIYDAWILGR